MAYFEDLEVGQAAEATHLIEASVIEAFGHAVGDLNPVHFDEAYAATTPFGWIVFCTIVFDVSQSAAAPSCVPFPLPTNHTPGKPCSSHGDADVFVNRIGTYSLPAVPFGVPSVTERSFTVHRGVAPLVAVDVGVGVGLAVFVGVGVGLAVGVTLPFLATASATTTTISTTTTTASR